jgi:glutamyl-tRNA synthetase
MQCITRFAPSPTGFLHIGNARTALINFLYAKQRDGVFTLRIDDTDASRCQMKFLLSILDDLSWLNLHWDKSFNQLSRKDRYKSVAEDLKKSGRIYPCYETKEELENKRSTQIQKGKPPIYDREALSLTQSQIEQLNKSGKVPYYRFLLNKDTTVKWKDLIKGDLKFEGRSLSDPVVLREDGTITYLLSSVIDDVDENITDIIRGEDHVSNTAIQIQLFEALKAGVPNFGHLSLLHSPQGKISKRSGGEELHSMRQYLHPMAINSFMTFLGTSHPIEAHQNIADLIKIFDITTYSKAQTHYHEEELYRINAKLIKSMQYSSIQKLKLNTVQSHDSEEPYSKHVASLALKAWKQPVDIQSSCSFPGLSENLWEKIKYNIHDVSEIDLWCKIVKEEPKKDALDNQYLELAANTLPATINEDTTKIWLQRLSELTQKKGKELFLPIRLALTGLNEGPHLSDLLLVLGRDAVIKRLTLPR